MLTTLLASRVDGSDSSGTDLAELRDDQILDPNEESSRSIDPE